MRLRILKGLLFILPIAHLAGQTPELKIGVVYMCTGGVPNFKVFACDVNAVCDFQNYKNGQANQRGQALRVQLAAALSKCHVQTPAEAQSSPQRGEIAPPAPIVRTPRPSASSQPPANMAAGAGVFKAGDMVRSMAFGGWQDARVLQVKGNMYYIRFENGVELWRTWPDQIRRQGKLTAEDHALGQYDLHDKVQVMVNGKWMEGEIVGQNVNMYTVQLPGERTLALDGARTVTTTAQNVRPSNAPPPAQRAAGQPPKAGLVSCAGKYEGRYELASGTPGMKVVFRSGKATIAEGLGGDMEFECFTGGGKIVFYKAGSFTPFAYGFDINNDGTLETPLGDIKKKGN